MMKEQAESFLEQLAARGNIFGYTKDIPEKKLSFGTIGGILALLPLALMTFPTLQIHL